MDRDFPRRFQRKPYDLRPRHRIGKTVFRTYNKYDVGPPVDMKHGHDAFLGTGIRRPVDTSHTINIFQDFDAAPDRIDNISDTALRAFPRAL